MGKNQHSKDRLFITASEWRDQYGGKKKGKVTGYKSLPFDCCSLTFTPFESPVCTREGHVYEILNILPYLSTHNNKDPVTGKPLSRKELITLHFHKNAQGKYHCPVTFKEFTNHSHIVAIATSGNVYSHEAVKELNITPKNWADLISNERFKRSDIITIQDPQDNKKREYSNFHHIQKADKAKAGSSSSSAATASSSRSGINSDTDPLTKKLLDDLAKKREASAGKAPAPGLHASSSSGASSSNSDTKFRQKLYTTGLAAASFTSSSLTPVTENQFAADENDPLVQKLRWDRIRTLRKKGYITMTTTHGDLNIELHFDYFPKTCENFMTHAVNGYYTGTEFHRLIKGFMIQGGDPTGTGRGGESIWKKPFEDEFHLNWRHSERGVLSMANAGPNSNNSQFYITFKPCSHLDDKHTVFGRVVGNLETLDKFERVPVDEKENRPFEPIRIKSFQVFENPVEDVEKLFAEEQAAGLDNSDAVAAERRRKDKELELAKTGVVDDSHHVVKVGNDWRVMPKDAFIPKQVGAGAGVGKYMSEQSSSSSSNKPTKKRVVANEEPSAPVVVRKKKKKLQQKFGDFSSW